MTWEYWVSHFLSRSFLSLAFALLSVHQYSLESVVRFQYANNHTISSFSDLVLSFASGRDSRIGVILKTPFIDFRVSYVRKIIATHTSV